MINARYYALLCLLVAGLFACSSTVSAQGADEDQTGTFANAISNMAAKVKLYLDEKNEPAIKIGEFAGPGASTAGRSIQVALTSALEQRGIAIKSISAKWTLRGKFEFQPGDRTSTVLINAVLVDVNGAEVSGFRDRIVSAEITSIEDITRVLGVTIDVQKETEDRVVAKAQVEKKKDSLTGPEKRQADKVIDQKDETLVAKVKDSIANPSFELSNGQPSQIKASGDSQFSMEMLVRRKGKASFSPLAVQTEDGIPFIDGLQAGDVYQIRVLNGAQHDVGVKLSIDGINVFALSQQPEYRELGVWLVRAGQSGTIKGWYLNPDRQREFLITSEDKVLELPPSGTIGTITAQFFHAWGETDTVPAIEQLASPKGVSLRTKPGVEIGQQTTFKKSFFGQQMLASLSLRYTFPQDLPPAN